MENLIYASHIEIHGLFGAVSLFWIIIKLRAILNTPTEKLLCLLGNPPNGLKWAMTASYTFFALPMHRIEARSSQNWARRIGDLNLWKADAEAQFTTAPAILRPRSPQHTSKE
jgi:hypothetical protein